METITIHDRTYAIVGRDTTSTGAAMLQLRGIGKRGKPTADHWIATDINGRYRVTRWF